MGMALNSVFSGFEIMCSNVMHAVVSWAAGQAVQELLN